MAKAYYSAVLDRPAKDVWPVVRDFNNYPRYIEGVDQSAIEDEKSGDSVGAVRRFRYGGQWIRQRLVALSDADRSFTYAGCEPFRFPSKAGAANPLMPIDYEGTLRVTPVVDGNRAFVEWWLNFDDSRRTRSLDFVSRQRHLAVGRIAAGVSRRVKTASHFKSLGVLFPAACGEVKNIFLVDTPSACGGVVH
ncbi:MAG: SRPBCC family protein [Gammaproteobacteria bacterium]